MVFAPLKNPSLVLLSSLLVFCLLLSIFSSSHFLVLAVFALLRVMKSQWIMQSALHVYSSIKKAIMKVLAFHVVREICLLFQLVVNTTIFVTRSLRTLQASPGSSFIMLLGYFID